jgi:primosomal protein N' (replication factor Y) (superfamily II helicase)
MHLKRCWRIEFERRYRNNRNQNCISDFAWNDGKDVLLYLMRISKMCLNAKLKSYIHLAEEYREESALNHLLSQLSKAPKQEELLLAFMSSMNGFNEKMESVSRKELLKRSGAKAPVLQQMIKKGIFNIEARVVSRLGGNSASQETVSLSEAQEIALKISVQASNRIKWFCCTD